MGTNICKNTLITFVAVLVSVLFYSAVEAAVSSKEGQLFDKGYKYVLAHQPEKAVETFRSFLKEFPNSPSKDAAMYWLGKSLVQVKSIGEAKKVFSEIAKQFPDSPFVPHSEKELEALDTQVVVGRTDTKADIKNLVENAVKALNELQLRLVEAEKKADDAAATMAKAVAEKDKLLAQLEDEKKKTGAMEAEFKNLTDNAAKAILELQTKVSKPEKKAGAPEAVKLKQ